MMLPVQKLEPYALPPGTQVGPWQVKAYEGGGAYGMVFRAVRVGQEQAGEVALKVACYAGDARFEREVWLLTHVHHPSVPRLLGHGQWQAPGGGSQPYLVMEWVEGWGLYEWARRSNPSSRQVLEVLAQVAGAVAGTHAAGGVHRDVKGDNIRVSAQGQRAVLMDFGAGTYAGAAPLTREALPPGTDDYRSPEAWEYALRQAGKAPGSYAAQPEDDVFALGVCAYRLVTGWYLPPLEVRPEEPGPWRMEWKAPRPPVELNPRVEPGLSELIARMLARRPEERPTALELAEALKEAARKAGAGAERPLFQGEELAVAVVDSSVPTRREGRGREGRSAAAVRVPAWARGRAWVAYAASAMLGAVGTTVVVLWEARPGQEGPGEVAQPTPGQAQREEEPVGLGDTGLMARAGNAKAATGSEPLSRPIPRTPLEGQRRAPDCIPPIEVTINGGCWIAAPSLKPPCGDQIYEWQGGCYIPTLSRPKQSTSEPPRPE